MTDEQIKGLEIKEDADCPYVGKKMGRLMVTKYYVSYKWKRRFKCVCDCGAIVWQTMDTLNRGRTRSCGCLRKEEVAKKMTIHGYAKRGVKERLYNIFIDMKKRCYNPNNKSYKYYGGRGIDICQEWLEDFTKFREWSLKHGYADDLTIDRKDTDRGYCPDNCRWIKFKYQAQNRRVLRNKSGKPGVMKVDNRWRADICIDNKVIYLGLFNTFEQAVATKEKAELKYHPYR